MTTYIRKQGKYIIGTNFGFGNDIAVEQVMTKDDDGIITVVSSKMIGKAKDFDSEAKRNNYFNKTTTPIMHKEENNLPRLDLMIDMETVSNAENAGILSLAILPFSKTEEDTDFGSFYKVIDLATCYMAGMNMVGCQEWWITQDPKAISAIVNAPKKEAISGVINAAYAYLSALAEQYELVIWSRGTDYDFPKLEWCFRKFVEKPTPYKYYNKRDVRTWIKETRLDESQFEFEGVKHNALDDCRHQIKLLRASFNQLEPRQTAAHPEPTGESPNPLAPYPKSQRPSGNPGSKM